MANTKIEIAGYKKFNGMGGMRKTRIAEINNARRNTISAREALGRIAVEERIAAMTMWN